MGIAVRELLALEYFKDFYVIAGKNGLDKEIQGVTLLEAPDALRWSKGKELILSSGYVIRQCPHCIRDAFKEGSILDTSALMIKRERYLDTIPDSIIALYDEHDIPLISMPFAVPWMELMSHINTAVMNRTIRRFRLGHSTPVIANQSYKEIKIKKILQAVESEMKFPALLYDLAENRSYYSSPNFLRATAAYASHPTDFFSPSRPHTKHTLCDYLNMCRIRLINIHETDAPRISWITVPIVINDILQAYFVIMESLDFIDYYDEYTLRIAFLALHGVYEQIITASHIGNIGFENFIHFALSFKDNDLKQLFYQANLQSISMNAQYIYVVFGLRKQEERLRKYRTEIIDIFNKSLLKKYSRIAFLNEDDGIILIDSDKLPSSLSAETHIVNSLNHFNNHLSSENEKMSLEFGVCYSPENLTHIKENVDKCRRVLRMGKILMPDKNLWDYDMLGPLTWIQIPDRELEILLLQLKSISQDGKNRELLMTLKIYLESNLNFSVTADKMYVHINTIRKRIDKINAMLDIHWDSHISRLKYELLLQFLHQSF